MVEFIAERFISLYGAPLSFLELHSSLFGPDGIGSRCIPNVTHTLSQFWPMLQNVSKTLV